MMYSYIYIYPKVMKWHTRGSCIYHQATWSPCAEFASSWYQPLFRLQILESTLEPCHQASQGKVTGPFATLIGVIVAASDQWLPTYSDLGELCGQQQLTHERPLSTLAGRASKNSWLYSYTFYAVGPTPHPPRTHNLA